MQHDLRALALGLALLVPAAAAAQQAPPQAPATPSANPADVQTVDGIIRALYEVVSADSGVERNWNRMRSIFHPQARLIPLQVRQGTTTPVFLTVEDYVTRIGPNLMRQGFHEREIARRSETYANLVHVFSTYAAFRRQADPAPFMRGINSIQLYNDGQRYWIMQIMWWTESPTTQLPPRYLVTENHE